MAKADVVREAVELGLGTEEELSLLTVKVINDKIVNHSLAGDFNKNIVQTVETKEETACNHEWHKVRVIATPNYTCIKCKKCGAEKKVDD